MGSGKHRWKFSFHFSPPSSTIKKQTQNPSPKEFICPISGNLMADPVIVSSGQTFEHNSIRARISLSYNFSPSDSIAADFTTVIPNLALRATILNWCRNSIMPEPKPLDFASALKLVQKLKSADSSHKLLDRTFSSVSEESVLTATRPFCYSSSSSCEIETHNPNLNKLAEEDEIVSKLKSSQVFDQEDGVVLLRKITRTMEETRAHLCTPRLLSALRWLISSRYSTVQVNSVAALVNLSLENQNKVKIVRSGIVLPLIDVLRGGFPEAQDHAAGALFSLALDHNNKTAIGVLGALPPLVHALRSESERARHDSSLALYHLSLVQSNRAKLVNFGAVQSMLSMVKSGHMAGRIMLVLCNLAGSVEGRPAMLDGGAVECLVGMLSRSEFDSEWTRDCCVTALYGLSYGGLRFKGLAKEAGTDELLEKLEVTGSERTREKAKKILEVMRRRYEEEEEEVVNWEALFNSGEVTRSRFELGCEKDQPLS